MTIIKTDYTAITIVIENGQMFLVIDDNVNRYEVFIAYIGGIEK